MAELTFRLVLDGLSLLINNDGDYRLLSYDGIEATDYDVLLADNANLDGGYVQAERIKARPISIEFMITDMARAEMLRASLIKFLKPKVVGTLYVTRTGVTRRISFKLATRPEFTQKYLNVDPIRISINLICPDPYFFDEDDTKVNFFTSRPRINFPMTFFPGGGLTTGLIHISDNTTIINGGDADIGIICDITALGGAVTNPKITIDGIKYVKAIVALDEGSKLQINTRPGEKNILIDGESVFLYDKASVFFAVAPGEHTVTISADAGVAYAKAQYTYALKYLGV